MQDDAFYDFMQQLLYIFDNEFEFFPRQVLLNALFLILTFITYFINDRIKSCIHPNSNIDKYTE